jgi:hypothetical protein
MLRSAMADVGAVKAKKRQRKSVSQDRAASHLATGGMGPVLACRTSKDIVVQGFVKNALTYVHLTMHSDRLPRMLGSPTVRYLCLLH